MTDFRNDIAQQLVPVSNQVFAHAKKFEGIAQREANSKWMRTKCANLKISVA